MKLLAVGNRCPSSWTNLGQPRSLSVKVSRLGKNSAYPVKHYIFIRFIGWYTYFMEVEGQNNMNIITKNLYGLKEMCTFVG